MPSATSTAATCAICGHSVTNQPTVPTVHGGVVHITCADRQARGAHRRRTAIATVAGAFILAVLTLAAASGLPGSSLVLLAVLLPIAHVVANWRWWRISGRRLTTRLRLRRW